MQIPSNLTLSHLELRVVDRARMEDFYTRVLGFVVTDRGDGANGLVFLSRSPHEHHQIVLNPGELGPEAPSRLDHVAFRVNSLSAVRRIHTMLTQEPEVSMDTVSHGTTWSVYFRDPEGNRVEVFTDTPWHVDQPVRFPVDFTLSDEALHQATEAELKRRPGFCLASEWNTLHAKRFDKR
jgi:catechol-2,3-dioxygenase